MKMSESKKPNLIYVKSFYRTVDNSGERHFLKFENKTSGSPKTNPPGSLGIKLK